MQCSSCSALVYASRFHGGEDEIGAEGIPALRWCDQHHLRGTVTVIFRRIPFLAGVQISMSFLNLERIPTDVLAHILEFVGKSICQDLIAIDLNAARGLRTATLSPTADF